MTKLIIEADFSSEELQVLISEIMKLHRDVFKKPLVLQQTDVSGSLPIPKEHEYHTWDNGSPMYVCPNCNEAELGFEDKFCPNCGQMQRWQ